VTSGRSYLAAEDPMMAALHFGVAIRLAPESAAAVLEAIGERQELPLQLVRGDALRLLGMEIDAGEAYQSVASALSVPKSAEPEPAPAQSVEPEPAPAQAAADPIVEELPPLRWD
jgi:hypothetical protein